MALYRITVDIDTKNPFLISLRILGALKFVSKIKMIILKPSNSKGYHLIIWTSKRYTQKQKLNLRKLLFDDKRRIEIDKKRKKPKQYLFFLKRKLKR